MSRPTTTPWPAVILDIAREFEGRNPDRDLTGFLLFSRDCYLHFLEGPADALDLALAELAGDRRREAIWTATGAAPRARLAGLPMGYFDADREATALQADPLWRRHQEWREADAAALIAMLVEIAREKYPSALSGKPHTDG